MKLWDSLTTCLILLSVVPSGSLLRSPQQSTATRRRGRAAESPLEPPPVQTGLSPPSPGIKRSMTANSGETRAEVETYAMEEPLPDDFEDVIDFIKVTISRTRRSSSFAVSSDSSSFSPSSVRENLSSRTRYRREKKKGAKQESGKGGRRSARFRELNRKSRGGSRRGQDCVLKQIHLNVSDLGLGHRSSEEMIFRYCSGPCRKPESNYDKILFNLVHKKKLPSKDISLQACCRPIAFDDDLSFLDDSLVYHTVKKHSARKCGCV